MRVESPDDLAAICRLMREQGITRVKVGDFEMELGAVRPPRPVPLPPAEDRQLLRASTMPETALDRLERDLFGPVGSEELHD